MRATFFVLLAGVVFTSTVADAQAIQKWKTPDGKLYFGDRPPAGSTKIGEEGSNELPAGESFPESPPPSAEQEKLSIDVSRERARIEKALNDNAERLEEIDKEIAEVQRSPNLVPAWMERRAGVKNEKADTLRELGSQKRTTLETIANLWKRFDQLDAKVKKAYEGNPPDWWRSTLSCAKCPTRSEAENSLR
jgi:hypothetical protein